MSIMLLLVLTIFSAFFSVKCDEIDPSKFDYCMVQCGGGVHPACDCPKIVPAPHHFEILNDMPTFRRQILDAFNLRRNRIASGMEHLPTAENMMILNYDLELEHLARCYARSRDKWYSRSKNPRGLNFDCLVTSNGKKFVQFQDFQYPSEDKGYNVSLMIFKGYNEGLSAISTDMIGSYKVDNKSNPKYVTMLWSSITHVGCARALTPQLPKFQSSIAAKNHVVFYLFCNFLIGTKNVTSIYKAGKICNSCPESTSCNGSKYESLCGKEKPVPESVPYLIPNPDTDYRADPDTYDEKYKRDDNFNTERSTAEKERNTTNSMEKGRNTTNSMEKPDVTIGYDVNHDPSKLDYCTIQCGGGLHPACKCPGIVPAPHHFEILDDMPTFRKTILDAFNVRRNRVASGMEHLPTAEDMMILNYDLELEHLARCYARNTDLWYSSPKGPGGLNFDCLVTSNGKKFVQFHDFQYPFVGGGYRATLIIYKEFNEGLSSITTDMIESFKFNNKSNPKYVTMLWSSVSRVGCARAWTPQLPMFQSSSKKKKYLVFYLFCNFLAGSDVASSLYKAGKTCISCPQNTKCNESKYEALCGKEEPIPELVPHLVPNPDTYDGKDYRPDDVLDDGNFDGSKSTTESVVNKYKNNSELIGDINKTGSTEKQRVRFGVGDNADHEYYFPESGQVNPTNVNVVLSVVSLILVIMN